jgi:cytochrome P450
VTTSVEGFPAYPSPELNEHPYSFFAALREARAIYRVGSSDTYLLSRYDDIMWAVQHPEIFSSKIHLPNRSKPDPAVEKVARQGYPLVPSLQENDPPEHNNYRRLVQNRFTPAAVRRHESTIRRIVDDLIDTFIERGSVDFVSEFARPLPLRVILSVLDLPPDRYADLKRWSDGYLALTSQLSTRTEKIAGRHCLNEMQRFFADQLGDRASHPSNDLITTMARAIDTESGITFDGVVNMLCRGMIIAGNETTVFLLTNTMLQLLRHPDLTYKVSADHSLLVPFIEESLRYESPNQYLARTVVHEVERHGVKLPKGATVLLLWGSANRDESHFDCPAHFNPARNQAGSPHLAFGHGIHNCLGSHLARREAIIAFAALLNRLDGLILDLEASDLAQIGNDVFRAPKRLALQFRPGSRADARVPDTSQPRRGRSTLTRNTSDAQRPSAQS